MASHGVRPEGLTPSSALPAMPLAAAGVGLVGRPEAARPVLRLVRLFALGGSLQHLIDDQPGVLADRLLDLVCDLRVLLQERLGVLAALADALAVEGEPGAGLLDDAGAHAQVHQLAGLGDALAV